MLSLDQIKQQLTELSEGQDKLIQSHAALALDLQNARHELAAVMRQSTLGLPIEEVRAGFAANGDGVSFIRGELGQLSARLTSAESEIAGDFAKLFNGHGVLLQKFSEWIDTWNRFIAAKPAPRPRKALAKRRKSLLGVPKKHL